MKLRVRLAASVLIAAPLALPSVANANDEVIRGLINLGGAIVLDQMQRQPAPNTPSNPAATAEPRLSREQATLVQARLNLLGFNVGQPDGVIGNRSRVAISQFQSSIGAAPTGYLTQAQVALLTDGAGDILQGNRDVLSRQETLEFQQALNAAGYDVGQPDGIAGRRTAVAVSDFLSDRGLDPYETSLRDAYELATGAVVQVAQVGEVGAEVTAPMVATDAAAPQDAEPAILSSAQSDVIARFGLETIDGAVVTGDESSSILSRDNQRSLARLALQLLYQADPTLVAREPIRFASILDTETRNRFFQTPQDAMPQTSMNYAGDGLSWKARNEFEVSDLLSSYTEAVETELQANIVPLPLDIVQIRTFELRAYDAEREAFELYILTHNTQDGSNLTYPGRVVNSAPLPFSAYPDSLAMAADEARALLEHRGQDRRGYLATRMSLVDARLENNRLQFALRYQSSALYRDRDLTTKDMDLPPFSGAFFAEPGEALVADGPRPIAPDTALEFFVREHADRVPLISDSVWTNAATLRFLYEREMARRPELLQALDVQRFTYEALRNSDRPTNAQVSGYREAVLSDRRQLGNRVLCQARVRWEGENFVVSPTTSCGLSLTNTIYTEGVRASDDENGKRFYLLTANGNYMTTTLSFADDPRFYEGYDITVPVTEVDLSQNSQSAFFEFEIEGAVSPLSSENAHRGGYFTLLATPVSIRIGNSVIPFERTEDVIAAMTKGRVWHDILGVSLGQSRAEVLARLVEHAASLNSPQQYVLSHKDHVAVTEFILERTMEYSPHVDVRPIYPVDGHEPRVSPGDIHTIFTSGIMVEQADDSAVSEQTLTYFDPQSGEVVALSRYQAFSGSVDLQGLMDRLKERYGAPNYEEQLGLLHNMIWVEDVLVASKLNAGQNSYDVCGYGVSRNWDELRVSGIGNAFQPWRDSDGEPRTQFRDRYGFDLLWVGADCGKALIASLGEEGLWLGMVDAGWVHQRRLDLEAQAQAQEASQRQEQVQTVQF